MRSSALSDDLILLLGLGIGAYFLFRMLPSASQTGADIGSGIVNGALGAVSGSFNAGLDALIKATGYDPSVTDMIDPTGAAVSGGGSSGGGTSGGGGGGW